MPSPPRPTVAIVRARAEHVLDDIDRVLELAGLTAWLRVDEPAVLVAAVDSPFPFPGANSTPWQLEGAIRGLQGRGAHPVRCPDEHPVLRAYVIERGAAGAPVLLPTLKCDAATTINGATRLAAGRRRTFSLMDGTTAGDGPGPRALRPVVKNVVLASSDPVALDAVAATLMGFEPESIAHLRDAADAGLGVVRVADIDVVGDAAIAAQRWGFTIGGRVVDRVRERAGSGGLGDLLARGTLAYRDLRWPLRDRAVFDHWRDATAWGHLFDRYDSLGALAATPAGS